MTNKPPFAGEGARRVRLGELISKAKTERCGDRSFPVLSMTMHDGIIAQSERFKKAIASKDVSSYKVVYPGQLVVGFPIDEGVIYVLGFDKPGIMSPAYNVWDIDASIVFPGYLELALHGPSCMAYYADKMRGTTARRRTLTSDNLTAMSIPLPDFSQQKRIVDIFGTVRAQMNVCRRQFSLFDNLVKSRFVEMFGDPTNGVAWPSKRLDEICTIVTGNTPPRKDPSNYGDYIEWCKTDNITDAKYLTTASEMLSEEGALRGRVVPAGSILMACIAGSVKSIGKVAVADRSVAFNQQINALIPSEMIDVEYLLWALRLSKDYLCSGVNMQLKGILNKTSLSAKSFCVPPLALQQQFAAFAAEVDKSRVVVQKQIEKLQALYDSLAQEYFG